ncbi:alpha/beta fold hydrolase [Rhizomonospora bruguierae]|uniref:alpha/beta fold hydrolase n=1 Tax=Rhizomonospora bruguierae TaxID=1581705 RepID=UPI001BCBAD48|nr:hypothetical protein [Micromonospora sp. NBRC 107566]
MNLAILRRGLPEEAGASGVEAWPRIERVTVPTTVARGDLDLPHIIDRCTRLAERLPSARAVVLPGVAHLPSLERPAAVAALIREAVAAG